MKETKQYDEFFKKYSNGIDWLLLKSQVKHESAFDPKAKSKVGARGLAQFMPGTWKEWSRKLKIENPDIENPEHNIRCQSAYMRFLLNYYSKDITNALMAYNWGMGNVDKWLKKGKPGNLIPVETFNYVARIIQSYKIYKEEEKKDSDDFVNMAGNLKSKGLDYIV